MDESKRLRPDFNWDEIDLTPKGERSLTEVIKLLTNGGKGRYQGIEHHTAAGVIMSKTQINPETHEQTTTTKVKRKVNKKDEDDIQKQFIIWLRKEYPGIKFRTDWFAGHYCPSYVKEQYINAQSGRSFPDVFILKPTKHYSGLLIETKKDASEVFLADLTTLRSIAHIHDQYKEIIDLRALGYCAGFGLGLDHMKRLTKRYMEGGIIAYSRVIIKPLNESEFDKQRNIHNDEVEKIMRGEISANGQTK